jgi:hypothetical protein
MRPRILLPKIKTIQFAGNKSASLLAHSPSEQTIGKLKRFNLIALRCEKPDQNYAFLTGCSSTTAASTHIFTCPGQHLKSRPSVPGKLPTPGIYAAMANPTWR